MNRARWRDRLTPTAAGWVSRAWVIEAVEAAGIDPARRCEVIDELVGFERLVEGLQHALGQARVANLNQRLLPVGGSAQEPPLLASENRRHGFVLLRLRARTKRCPDFPGGPCRW